MRGQTLFEIIIALAIFSMIASILASVSLGGLTALTQGGDYTKASALAEEGIEALRSIRDGAWNELRPASGSQTAAVTGKISVDNNQWVFTVVTPTETLPKIMDKFTRSITLDAVCRDPQTRIITTCSVGKPDPHTERATVKVSWEVRPGVTNTVTRSSYITSWDSKTWRQTDWSGGAGQGSWIDTTKFDSMAPLNSIDYSGGKITLKKTVSSGTWSRELAATNLLPKVTLNGVDVFDENNAWIVGNSKKLMRFSGGSWAPGGSDISPQGTDFRDVEMLSATEGWIVGTDGWIARCLVIDNVLRCDGSNAGSRDLGNQTWNSISMVSATDGWAVGNGGAIAHYIGGVWSLWTQNVSPTTEHLNSIHMVSSTDGLIVGTGGKILRFTNGSWMSAIDTGNNVFHGVRMLDANSGFAVSASNRIYRWGESAWREIQGSGTDTWYGVAAVAANDVWVVGSGGTRIHWNGSSWTAAPLFDRNSLRAVDVYRKADTSVLGFAVGSSNTVLRLTRPPPYATSGSLISSAFDMVGASPAESIEWDEYIPASCTKCAVKFQIQTVDIGGQWFPQKWMGPDGNDGDEDDYFTLATGHLISNSVNGRQGARYRVELTGDGANTPILREVRIQYK